MLLTYPTSVVLKGSLSKGATLFGVNMVVNTEFGNTYSEGEYRRWLSAAGFEGIEVLHIPQRDTHFILARKPEQA
jgi:hypothetical protein